MAALELWQIGVKTFEAHHWGSAKNFPDSQNTSNIPLYNKFTLLSHSVTCSDNPVTVPSLMGLDQAQVVCNLKPAKERNYLVENLGPSTLNTVSDRPISPGLAISAPGLAISASADIYYSKPKPISFGLSSKKAISEPNIYFKHSLKWATKVKHFKPKQHMEFTKGRILSWEDFQSSKKLPKNKQVVSALTDPLQKEKNSVTSGLKVYSRNKIKRFLVKDVLSIQDGDILGDFLQGSDSNFEGDNHLRSRPDDTSLSSLSDSEETYFSDKITETDIDSHFEGMSRLFIESESTRPLVKSALTHQNNGVPNYSVPQLNGNLPPIEGMEEVRELSGCLEKEVCPPNDSQLKGNRKMEWKKAQALLTQMGIQLIHDTKKTKTEKTITKARRKKGSRELQNLKFNVNYEGSCSKGFINSQ